MRPLYLLVFCFVLTSCHYLEKKKLNSEDLLQEELKTFTWDDVDTYPTFKDCESITDKPESKVCFQNTITKHVTQYLGLQNLVVSKDINDTIIIDLKINNNGELKAEQITMTEETKEQIPELDSLLRQSLKDLPPVFPAIKRGQEVTTVFKLPVIVQIR